VPVSIYKVDQKKEANKQCIDRDRQRLEGVIPFEGEGNKNGNIQLECIKFSSRAT